MSKHNNLINKKYFSPIIIYSWILLLSKWNANENWSVSILKIFSHNLPPNTSMQKLCFVFRLTFFFCFGDFKIGTQRKSRLQFSFTFHLDSNKIQEYIIVEKYTFFKKQDKKCRLIVFIKLIIIWWETTYYSKCFYKDFTWSLYYIIWNTIKCIENAI